MAKFLTMEKWKIAWARFHAAIARWILEQEDTPERKRYLANLELEAVMERRLLEAHTAKKPRDSQGRYTKRSAIHRA
ncbi:hypothetical protein [Acetobacter orientalis]|uniref:hypothetical protein n=1 Tax=Acetobacter orientalis TaxID=146474 RepID=UPI0039EA3B7A